MIALYFIFWRRSKYFRGKLYMVFVSLSLALLAIFYAFYYSMYYSVLKYDYLTATQCKIISNQTIFVDDRENYMLLTMQFMD